MKTTKVVVMDDRSHRLKARVVDTDSLVARAAELAIERNAPVVCARHGGSVCNSYGWAATTEAVVVVAIPHNDEVVAVVYATELPANKVTLSGVAANTVGERVLFDGRASDESKKAAKSRIICQASLDAGIASL